MSNHWLNLSADTIGPRPFATNCKSLTFNVTDEAPEPLELL